MHLEVVVGLSTDAFLNGLRQFIARRGKPAMIICDNAPQFKSAKSVLDYQWLQVMSDENVQLHFSHEGICWKYTTEFAPWQGRFYERLVGLAKRALRKSIGRSLLSMDRLTTLVSEIKAIMNTRPLTYVHDDVNSAFVLTPAHFMTGKLQTGLAVDSQQEDPDVFSECSQRQEVLRVWKGQQAILNSAWKMWREDYLQSLREASRLRHYQSFRSCPRTLEVGEVVTVHDSSRPRAVWRFGIIQECRE